MATHSSIPAWGNLMDRGAWQATVHGVARVGHDLATKQHNIKAHFRKVNEHQNKETEPQSLELWPGPLGSRAESWSFATPRTSPLVPGAEEELRGCDTWVRAGEGREGGWGSWASWRSRRAPCNDSFRGPSGSPSPALQQRLCGSGPCPDRCSPVLSCEALPGLCTRYPSLLHPR